MTETRTFKSMCPMNCHPTLCGMQVEVADDQLVSITGDPSNPDSQGNLCMRGKAAHEIVGNPQRLLTPLIRDQRGADTWRQTDWESALDLIAGKMREVGPKAVGLWQGHGNAANDYGIGVKRAQMDRFANLARWGTPRGGMFVQLDGTGLDGKPLSRFWNLIAEGDDGPFIPAMAAAAIIARWLRGEGPRPGARPAHRELELADFQPFFDKLAITHTVR